MSIRIRMISAVNHVAVINNTAPRTVVDFSATSLSFIALLDGRLLPPLQRRLCTTTTRTWIDHLKWFRKKLKNRNVGANGRADDLIGHFRRPICRDYSNRWLMEFGWNVVSISEKTWVTRFGGNLQRFGH